MKTLILIATFSLVFVKGICQTTYCPFPTDSAYWSIEHGYYDATFFQYHCTSTSHYAMFGDTSIQGNTYSKIYLSAFLDSAFIYSTASYFCALREDLNKKIFVRRPTDSIDVLLYDFSLSIGDSFCYQFFNPLCQGYFPVTGVDSILIDSNYRRRIFLSSFGDTQTWIEGIGNIYGLFDMQYVGSFITSLKCFKENGILKYQSFGGGGCHCDNFAPVESLNKNNKNLKTYPNPTNSILNIELNNFLNRVYSINILTSIGQIIKTEKSDRSNVSLNISELKEGIYFIVISDEQNNQWRQKFVKE